MKTYRGTSALVRCGAVLALVFAGRACADVSIGGFVPLVGIGLTDQFETFDSDPRVWLEHGPGRETSERPGWSAGVKAAEAVGEADEVLLRPRVMEMLHSLIDALTPFPEARVCAARKVEEFE